jgi:hypothetical protein
MGLAVIVLRKLNPLTIDEILGDKNLVKETLTIGFL